MNIHDGTKKLRTPKDFQKAIQSSNNKTFWVQICSLITRNYLFCSFNVTSSRRFVYFRHRFLTKSALISLQISDTLSSKFYQKTLCFRNRCFKIAPIFSIGFRSGLYAVHFNAFHFFLGKLTYNRRYMHRSHILLKNNVQEMQLFFVFLLISEKGSIEVVRTHNKYFSSFKSYCKPKHKRSFVLTQILLRFFLQSLVPSLGKTHTIPSLEMPIIVSSVKTEFCKKLQGFLSIIIHNFERKLLLFFFKPDFLLGFSKKTPLFLRIRLTVPLQSVS